MKNNSLMRYADIDQKLQDFRKKQSNRGSLPTLGKVPTNSNYQNSYSVCVSPQKDAKAHEKPSFFLKMNWALDPKSNYQVEN